MTDESKAVQAVAKATSDVVGAIEKLGGFVAKYVHGPMTVAMGIVEDKLKYQRWERQIRLFDRTDEILAGRGLSGPTRAVPLKLAIALIQGGSLEDDDGLQDHWAALLANAADGNKEYEVRRAFVSILEDLTPFDAHNFKKIYEFEVGEHLGTSVWTAQLPHKVTATMPAMSEIRPTDAVNVSLGNLSRLGLIVASGTAFPSSVDRFNLIYKTALGEEFFRAVTLS
jgi:hypothetical protein